MRYNDNYASASANVIAPKSDTAVQRDYLLGRLDEARQEKHCELDKLFNMYIDNTPKTYKELIEAIKGDKFTITKKAQEKSKDFDENAGEFGGMWPYGPLYGIVWDGPKPDHKGRENAADETYKKYNAAKDIIMTSSDGLKALQDFEAWLPVGKPN